MSKNIFRDMVAYEIYPTSFCDSNRDGIGDLKGILSKLDYIQGMGFNAIWFNPFYRSPFKDGGYDVENFFDVDPRFGTMDDFKEMVDKAHEKGIRVIVDLVVGHASFDNPDFLKSAQAERNEYSDLFIWNDNLWNKGNNLISGMFDRHGCYMVNFFAHQPAFNYGFKEIKEPSWQMSYKDKRTFLAREYMLKVMRYWLDNGADGFRVDMADSLVKNDEDKSATIEVWKWMFRRIRNEYPEVFFVSEWSDPKRAFKAGFDADFVLDHWDNFYHRFFRSDKNTRGTSIIHGNNDISFTLRDMRERFEKAEKAKSFLALISGNHDTWRIANYLNHEELKVFYMMLFCLPGIPFVLYGDEIGMKTSHIPSKDGGYQRTGTRIPMIWDDTEPFHGFTKGKESYLPFNPENTISVKQAMKDKESLYHFICELISLRKSIRDLKDPHVEIKEEKRVFLFERGNYTLIANLSKKNYAFEGTKIISSEEFEGKLPPGHAVLIKAK
ncbi:MAG: glycosylase [Erysipelotrichaceae bacterium]|nr:glycosylase [Erysipelotrichaceae bacterium]